MQPLVSAPHGHFSMKKDIGKVIVATVYAYLIHSDRLLDCTLSYDN